MIQIEQVVAGYTAENDILRGITLAVARAEIVALLGPRAKVPCSKPSRACCCPKAVRCA